MSEEIDKKNREEAKFNLGSGQLELIKELLDKASHYYLEGKMSLWFHSLKNIKLQIISRLDNFERSMLQAKEILITEALGKVNGFGLGDTKARNLAGYRIEKYEILIKDLLDQKGFLVPSKEDRRGLYGQASPEAEEV